MSDPDPGLRPAALPEDVAQEADPALLPKRLESFIDQAETRANLQVFIKSARHREAAMDHVLFHGPSGLGKTHWRRS